MIDTANDNKPLKVGLPGCGLVGTEVVRILTEQADHLAARGGARREIAGIAVRRPGRARDIAVDPALITTDAQALVSRGDLDLVIEVIGGLEPARSLILTALEHG